MANPLNAVPGMVEELKDKIGKIGKQDKRSGQLYREAFDIHFSKPQKHHANDLQLAGVAEVDITPPPGVPKGGYAAMSQTSVGFRARIKSRVFYIRPKKGKSVCILQADLHAGSAIIRNRVAELVAPHTDLDPANICLTCTHTHSGPGQLLESNFYNKFASHKPGLDKQLFEFVSRQIANAVIEAYENTRPANISSGTIDVTGLTRNRSLAPYLNNRGAHGAEISDLDPELKYKAVNPTLYMLRIDLKGDDDQFYPAGVFSNFSIHGTCLPATNDVFSADSWAYISKELEDWLETTYHTPWKPIHGPSQGTHGDIAPDVKDKNIGVPEAARIGKAIAKKAMELFSQLDNQGESDLVVQNGLRVVDFYTEPEIDNVRIAERPVVGTALTAGAFEHSTPVLYHLPFFKHGMGSARFFFPDKEQGHKRKIGGNLQSLVLPKNEFPHEIIFQTLRVGQFVLVGVPFEVSVTAGREIAAAVKHHLAADHQVCVASLTNGYTGYTTTAAEYEKQYYEGGHTLYGPNTNQFIAKHCGRLMAETLEQDEVSNLPDTWHYDMLCADYMVKPKPLSSGSFERLSDPEFVQDKHESYWAFRCCGPLISEVNWQKPLLKLETKQNGHWAEYDNDSGYDLEVRLLNEKDGDTHYEFRYYGQPAGSPNASYRFVVWHNGTCAMTSAGFGL
ncbi:MAG: neutral/alkaline non-lysosomal ceramidase N-terminal domain-containing protein [Pseudomonadales bacterium]|nr:neutral/alkaline non-lysosomal ceramidase N-terminal domain-containing protein [Pseudomonadales bacterium]